MNLRTLKKAAKALQRATKRLLRRSAPAAQAPHPFSAEEASAAQKRLEVLAPIPAGTVEAENHIDPQYDLHIIVPCYNVEKTLPACIDSILRQQTRYSFVVTLVNDGSTDRTPEILEHYRNVPNVQILQQKNRGLSGARNRALENILGRYIMFVDSDDMLREGAIETLLSRAMQHDADIVQGGYVNITASGLAFGKEGYDQEGLTSETGERLSGMAWSKVIRSCFFAHLKFPEGYWFEDTIFEFCVYPFCTRQYTVTDYVYSYRRNRFGITRSSQNNPKALDTIWITCRLMERLAHSTDVHTAAVQQLLLRQIALNCRRLSHFAPSVQQDAFIVMQHLYGQYYTPSDTAGLSPQLLALHQALATGDQSACLAALDALV